MRLEDAVDKTELNGYIADALTKVNENNTYTENSWNSFQSALKAAQKVAENVNATSEEVEKVTDLLTSSYEALTVSQRQGTLFPEYPQILQALTPYRSVWSMQLPMRIPWEMPQWYRPESYVFPKKAT